MFYTIYETTNTINGKKYVGAHKTDNLDDGYIGSGIALNRSVKKYGRDKFETIVLHFLSSEEEMYKKEVEIVTSEIVNNPNYYNMTLGGEGGWSHVDNTGDNNWTRSAEGRKKLSERMQVIRKNRPEWSEISRHNLKQAVIANTGKNHSPETISKIKNSLTEFYEINESFHKGKEKSSETKLKMKESWSEERKAIQASRMKDKIASGLDIGAFSRGKPKSELTKSKMIESAKNRKKCEIVVCPYCGKQGSSRAMGRWHFDNCKSKS